MYQNLFGSWVLISRVRIARDKVHNTLFFSFIASITFVSTDILWYLSYTQGHTPKDTFCFFSVVILGCLCFWGRTGCVVPNFNQQREVKQRKPEAWMLHQQAIRMQVKGRQSGSKEAHLTVRPQHSPGRFQIIAKIVVLPCWAISITRNLSSPRR